MEVIVNLKKNGAVNIKNVLDFELIERAKKSIERFIPQKSNIDVLTTPQNTVRKICYAFDKDEVFLDIISHPKVIHILKSIYGSDIVNILPTWEDILIKQPKTGIPVEIHQDLGLQSDKIGNVFSLAFHFHDTIENPVCFFEGSHKLGAITRDEIKNHQNKELYKAYLSLAGDVDIHNVLTLHYSEPNTTENPRYTWYVEFRTIKQIVEDSDWNEEWALQRQTILFYAIENRKRKRLPFEEIAFSRKLDLEKCINNIQLRIPHETNGVKYTDNEYNHFADHKTLF
jgi:ectoine hydroxylase-related dioxygenase (phytanoyl-CoA dioxygenase family)